MYNSSFTIECYTYTYTVHVMHTCIYTVCSQCAVREGGERVGEGGRGREEEGGREEYSLGGGEDSIEASLNSTITGL